MSFLCSNSSNFSISLLISILFLSLASPPSLLRRPVSVSFILGGPAAGKSTQCTKLVEEFGCVHLSAGDLLRAERESGSEVAQLIESYIREGAIVPVNITISLLRKAIEEADASRVLIDGFPRSEDNLLGWEQEMRDFCRVDSIIYMACSEQELERRLLERAKTSGRSDDNPTTIRKRFKTFVETTLPVIEKLQGSGLVKRVVAEDSISNVYHEMKTVFESVSKQEIIHLTRTLLACVEAGNWELYDMLSSSEVQTSTLAYDGWSNPLPEHTSVMTSPHVRFFGKSAVISYSRLIRTAQAVEVVQETRVWQAIAGKWKQTHLQR